MGSQQEEIKEETNKRPEKKAKQDDSSSSDDKDLVQCAFDDCALDLARKHHDRDRHEAISFIEKRIIQLEGILENRKDPRPIQRPCRVEAIDGPNACLLDRLETEDEIFKLRTKTNRSLQILQACLSIYKVTLTQLRKFNK
ncbi:Oidioi.mRNA.OKI2018_I69.XSR.g16940.t1.cds [Oikopleura dioica]|uniref:Oidioi.mRNA.OKI2018_I69.XSR.g16940.t1.cds n=1 Tax=Oikopleura dioica TaxID=34765 RepID=A0ABN7SMS5_OIKDI|nr:Oidioi.mRNA.OKI2018_I69.XSR.g16940.t1.cds [Oikopleura dioica]